MQCPRCGYILDAFDPTCPKCAYLARTGQTLPPSSNAASIPPMATGPFPTGQEYKVCPACSQRAILSMPVCGRCGYQYGFQSRQKERRTAAFVGGLLLLVVLLGFVGYCLAPKAGSAGSGGKTGLLMLPTANGGAGSSMVGAAVDSSQIQQRLLERTATTGGEIEVSLAWNTLTDLDLQVRDPSGELITAAHPHSASGGEQDVDANPTVTTPEGSMRAMQGLNPGPENVIPLPEFMIDMDKKIGMPDEMKELSRLSGQGDKAPPRYTHAPVEHIYFAHAPKGTYTVYAQCYSWREPNANPLPFTVEVRTFGKVFNQTSGTIGPANYITDNTAPTQVCQFVVQ